MISIELSLTFREKESHNLHRLFPPTRSVPRSSEIHWVEDHESMRLTVTMIFIFTMWNRLVNIRIQGKYTNFNVQILFLFLYVFFFAMHKF